MNEIHFHNTNFWYSSFWTSIISTTICSARGSKLVSIK